MSLEHASSTEVIRLIREHRRIERSLNDLLEEQRGIEEELLDRFGLEPDEISEVKLEP